MIDYSGLKLAVGRESGAIAEGLRAVSADAKVPTCPAWTVANLAAHVGQFSALWAHLVCEATGRTKTPYADPPPGADADWLAAWFSEQAGYLSEVLDEVAEDARVWTWDPSDNTARFVARRSAHELAVHRFDVQSASGATEPIEGGLAVDGMEEIFAMIRAWRAQGQDVGAGAGERLHLSATDEGVEWSVTLTPDGTVVDRDGAGAGTAGSGLTLSGAASDLELTLYDRPVIGPVEHHGDEGVLAAWKRAFTFD